MLLIGIINELLQNEVNLKQTPDTAILSYFLCQGTDSRLNNAASILRGVIYLLIIQRPFLISYVREKYDHIGRKLFEDPGAFFSLSEIFRRMLHDPRLKAVYLIIDALDECNVGLLDLLQLITQTVSERPTGIKWLISSRYRDEIEQILGYNDLHTRLSLESNADHISHAVNVYIDHKVPQLIALKNDKGLQEQVRGHMRQKSDGTFLWVALAFEELRQALRGNLFRVLDAIPKGLKPLYGQMLEHVQKLEDEYRHLCFLALSTATLAYRPLHMLEMLTFAKPREQLLDLEDLGRIINMCGSFLTIRDQYICFVHQSAKDYLIGDASATIFPSGPGRVHYEMFSHSLDALSNNLRRNIYNLKDPGPVTGNIKPDPDPLACIEYSCIFWLDHLCELDSQTLKYSQEVADNGRIFTFFTKQFLYWLESLGLICEVSKGILTIQRLQSRVQVCQILLQLCNSDTN
jgi:hypothetical protein